MVTVQSVILYARMWIEMPGIASLTPRSTGHPLCEDVDWNWSCFLMVSCSSCHPLCEDVDWNLLRPHEYHHTIGHPLCEDVDWNYESVFHSCSQIGSSSMRGCGLKSGRPGCLSSAAAVILYARMWIEMSPVMPVCAATLCHPLCEDVDWNCPYLVFAVAAYGHPPCEDVDWNCPQQIRQQGIVGSSSVRGCGLKSFHVIRP